MNPPNFSHEPAQLPLVLGRMENVSAPPKWKETSIFSSSELYGQKGTSKGGPNLVLLVSLLPNTPQKLPSLPQGPSSGITLSSTPVCDTTPAGEEH